jgi:hypothetical protein
MGFSYILDIVIGLFFIYLILSLLASEIQELIATLLQWRAVHVKQSIEGLLNGNEETEFDQAKKLANEIYNNPLIKDINHSAKGRVEKFLRAIGDCFGKKIDGVFGENHFSGPSSIGKQTFISALLETLHLDSFIRILTKLKLENFIVQKLIDQSYPTENKSDYNKFNNIKREIFILYDNDDIDTINVINRLYEESLKIDKTLYDSLFKDISKEHLLEKVKSSMLDAVQLLIFYRNPKIQEIYSKIELETPKRLDGTIDYQLFRSNTLRYFGEEYVGEEYISRSVLFVVTLNSYSSHINKEIENLTRRSPIPLEIPEPLQKSLYNLAKQSQKKFEASESQLQIFQVDLENWFDRSMIRAGGVYKRNSSLVALIIGFVIAVVANADTSHIVNRLAKDQVLRQSVSQSAEKIIAQSNGELTKETQKKLEDATNQINLPMGWNESNRTPSRFPKFKVFSSKNANISETIYYIYLPSFLTIFGWIISAIAISMGSSFWFDLLGRFIDIKNIGKKPTEKDL